MCAEHGGQRIDSYIVFEELLPAVHKALKAMVNSSMYPEFGTDWAWDSITNSKANGFLYQLESSAFLICFKILLKILYYLREVTVKLQMKAIDVSYAYEQMDDIVKSLEKIRENSESEFKKVYEDTTKLGQKLYGEQFDIKMPRTAGRQSHRSNPDISSAQDYFGITLFDEFLSHVVVQLQDRFVSNPAKNTAYGLLHLIPQKCIVVDGTAVPPKLTEALQYYSDDLPHPLIFSIEYEVWTRKWQAYSDPSKLPGSLIDVYKNCSRIQFPNIKALLQIALTLPVTSCECERSFSQLKLLETPSRSTMSDQRLSGLALMKIHRDYCMELSSPEKIKELVKKFNELHPRRMSLPFLLSDFSD